jgi:hypothetical protein
MPRCGCGDQCTCLIEGGIGVDLSGTGNANNKYVVDLDGAEVAGAGISWSANQFSAKLAAAGGLEFDGTGAIRTTVAGGAAGTGATVAALVLKGKDVLGGALGAGFMIKPPDLYSTFEYGLQIGLDMMQVPVRFLSDGTPVVRTSDVLARTSPAMAGAYVQDQDPHRWRTLVDRPGRKLYPDDNNTIGRNDPSEGHYGYLETGQRDGLSTLSDVFRRVGRRTVLVLDLRFPPRNVAGNYVDPTPLWRIDAFLARVKALITQYSLSDSVIVTTADLTVAATQGVLDVLDYFNPLGVALAPMLITTTDAAAHPADGTWPATWKWVFLSSALPRATIDTYVAKVVAGAPLNVILFNVARQYLRRTLVNSNAQTAGATGAGARGVLSPDPEYYSGEINNYRYRQATPTLDTGTLKHGLLPSTGDNVESMTCMRRGFLRGGYNAVWMDSSVVKPAGSASAWSLMPGANPLESPTSWAVDLGFGFDSLSGSYGQMMLAFGVATDHTFRDPLQQPVPDQNLYPLDSGYVLSFDMNGYLWLFAYDRGVRTNMVVQQRPYGAAPLPIGGAGWTDPYRGKPYYFRLGVNANGLRVSTIPSIGGVASAVLYDVKTALAKTYRGAYVYFGRNNWEKINDWGGFIDQPTFAASGAIPAGPTP